MTEYIEREGLLGELENNKRECYEIGGVAHRYFAAGVALAIEYAKKFPAADVAPVKRGRWEQHLLPLAWKCSVCRYLTSNRALKYNHMNYCPNCGAQMDGGVGGNVDR